MSFILRNIVINIVIWLLWLYYRCINMARLGNSFKLSMLVRMEHEGTPKTFVDLNIHIGKCKFHRKLFVKRLLDY